MQMSSSRANPAWYHEQVAQAPLDKGFPLPLSALSVRASGPRRVVVWWVSRRRSAETWRVSLFFEPCLHMFMQASRSTSRRRN